MTVLVKKFPVQSLTSIAIKTTLTAFLALAACTSTPKYSNQPEDRVTIMNYNVENLFDTVHDEGKDDFTFLPLKEKSTAFAQAHCEKAATAYYRQECLTTDWNEEVLKLKLARVADSILQVYGKGPDILVLEEVENKNVLHMLNQQLEAAHYQTEILIEGEDERGIDVAILSRFPLAAEAKLHAIEFSEDTLKKRTAKMKKHNEDITIETSRPKTRGILEAPLKLANGETLTVYGLHFPSQGAIWQERRDGVLTLNKLLETKGPKALAVAAGDSNITVKEDALQGLQSKEMASHWKVSHLIGCQSCQGTHHYRDSWSFLDVLLFSPSLYKDEKATTGSYYVDASSIRLANQGKYQTQMDGTPARFDAKRSIGVSDHFPLLGELVINH